MLAVQPEWSLVYDAAWVSVFDPQRQKPTTGTTVTLLTGSAPWVSKPAGSKGSLASPLRSMHSSPTSLSDHGESVVVVVVTRGGRLGIPPLHHGCHSSGAAR